jgi:hypothetical protein
LLRQARRVERNQIPTLRERLEHSRQ